MGISERRQNEIEAFKKKVTEAAGEIIIKQGYEKLSIRKIAEKIEYSPGIIYHYFKDKNEILSCVVEENYGNILKLINEVTIDKQHPENTIADSMKAYIGIMLKIPEGFKAILMNDIEAINNKVNVLERGISKKRKSMQALTDAVSFGIEQGRFKKMDPELTAQIIWTSTYGLLSRLILEKNVSDEQRERLINQHLNMMIHGLLK